jgi:glycogen debranching enzyme
MGLKKYGREAELLKLSTALFDAARAFDYYRLPELFCGISRSVHLSPVPYPVACRPQAWAAGTIPLLLQEVLGLCPAAQQNELLIDRPQLPSWLEEVRVRNLHIGRDNVDLLYEQRNGGAQVAVINSSADLRVSVVNHWPL